MASKPHQEADNNSIIKEKTVDNKDVITFKPRAFNIVWGNDSRYWRIPNPPRSFAPLSEEEAAELVQVSWLEVTGSCQVEPLTTYEISFTLSFNRNAFGWSGAPVFLMAKVGKKGKYKCRKLKEIDNLFEEPTDVPSNEDSFTVDSGQLQPDMRLYFGLYEVWSGKWKGGMRLHQAIVKEISK
ncbi:protein PHLOEM PROTEIN 2-LIKE A9-like [Hibiscus syriacus]|uniref:protein PHLOEM PROTEIN 2-LIKE A9-like n=1 Tax=Hibiscus syriacus TaxID=106335 RepID=UPI001920CDCB|nr:protein PHLOEM PROTEIN 2-LIKE A9-like [Hibiscus syriacus]